MTTAPYAKLRANIAGAGNLSGVLTGAAGATCQLSQDPAGVGSSFKYEITDYPEGWAVPAGWTADALSGVYSYLGLTPPLFTLPALPLWGKLTFALTVNNGDPGTSGLPKTQFIDRSTVVSTPDPSGNGFEDIAYGETNQWDSRRKWAGVLKRNIRRQAKQSLPAYASVPDGYVLSLVGGVPMWVPGTPTFTGDFGAIFTANSLTVVHYVRSDLGRTLAGSNLTSIAAQTGPTITEGAGGAGLATATTGLGGHAGFVTNSGQWGTYTLALSAPGTTPFHEWIVMRRISTGSQSFITGGVGLAGYFIQSDAAGASYGNNTTYAGPVTMTANAWGCLEVSFDNTTGDYIKFGAGSPSTGATMGNSAPAGSRALGANAAGGNAGVFEYLCRIIVTGSRANFVTAAAAAKTAAQGFYSGSIA